MDCRHILVEKHSDALKILEKIKSGGHSRSCLARVHVHVHARYPSPVPTRLVSLGTECMICGLARICHSWGILMSACIPTLFTVVCLAHGRRVAIQRGCAAILHRQGWQVWTPRVEDERRARPGICPIVSRVFVCARWHLGAGSALSTRTVPGARAKSACACRLCVNV